MRRRVDSDLAEKGFGQKSVPLSQIAQLFITGGDMVDNSASRATQPYKQVGLVFRCVEKLIAEIVGLQPVLSTLDEKIIESGPVYDLLFNNPQKSWQQFVTEAIGHYALTRDVFFVFTDWVSGKPSEITIISGLQMRAITENNRSDGRLIAWEFLGTGGQQQRFSLDEVVQWKNFNPYEPYHGIGPATAARLDIDYSFAAALYNASSLANGAEPGAILTALGNPSQDEVNAIRTNFDARHAGAGKTKRTVLLTGGLDVKSIAMKMADMQVAEITSISDKKICVAFGVPPELVGLSTEAQYAHGPAQRDFTMGTIMPLATAFGLIITTGILTPFTTSKFMGEDFPTKDLSNSLFYGGLRRSFKNNKYFRAARRGSIATQKKVFCWFDFSQNPVMQDMEREVAEKVLKYTAAGVPLNDIIEVHDLPYQQVPWGDDWWIQMGLVPASYTMEAGLEGITGPTLPEGDIPGETSPKSIEENIEKQSVQEKADQQSKLRLWRNWVISWAGIEREYNEALRKFFIRQQRILIEKLQAAMKESKSVIANTKADPQEIIARVVFDLHAENGKIRAINQTFFEKASELGIRQALSEISGLKGDALTQATETAKRLPAIKRALSFSANKITGVNRTTHAIVARQLKDGLGKEESLSQLTSRIQKALGSNRKRALSIARTSTAGAVSSGRHVGMRQAGSELKGWVDSHDEHVRPSHQAAADKYADGIPIDQAFEVGSDHLMYPGDPSGSAAEIINCRCVEVAVKADGKSIDGNHKFYSYFDMQKDKSK